MNQRLMLIRSRRIAVVASSVAFTLGLIGCGSVTNSTAPAPQVLSITGRVHGGQQPVTGAAIQLYAAGTTGYGAAATSLLTTAVQSGPGGSFTITGDYTCPSSSTQVYIAATGGNPGLPGSVNNSALAMMAALGPCGNLTPSTFIIVNELTTVAAAWPLAPFASSTANISTSATNSGGLANAFTAAAKVASVGSGTAPGPLLPAGATLPVAEINALANILSACVNSSGGTSGDGTACGNLFAASTPTGGTVPIDTIGAALNIARNPALNVGTLFALIPTDAPFQPSLSSAPNNWMIGINYTGGGLNQPAALALDATGNVWLANKSGNSLTELDNTGAAVSPATGFAANSLSAPAALAIDNTGYVWVANSGNSSLAKLSPSGTVLATYTGGGLNIPDTIAIDANANLWLGNASNGTVSEFSSAGFALSPGGGYALSAAGSPAALAINPH
jgi:hypothetical protein